MKRTLQPLLRCACIVLCSATFAACSRPAGFVTNTHTITVSNPDNAWGKNIQFVSGTGGCSLTVDGVKFELLDLASAAVDFEALGIQGIEVTGAAKISYRSNMPNSDSFMAVLDKPVAIRDGELFWGDESQGAVSDGDVFIADAEGLRPKP